MRKVLAQSLPLIVILIVLASIMQVFATTQESAGNKLSFWERILIAIGLRARPTNEAVRQFEYIPSRLQEPSVPSYQLPQPKAGRPLDETTSSPTPTPAPSGAGPASPPSARFQMPPLPPLPPSQHSTLGVKTVRPPLPPIPPQLPQILGVKTINTITSFFGNIWRSLITDLGLAKPPKPPIPPALPRTLGVQDQRPPLPPLSPIPPLTP